MLFHHDDVSGLSPTANQIEKISGPTLPYKSLILILGHGYSILKGKCRQHIDFGAKLQYTGHASFVHLRRPAEQATRDEMRDRDERGNLGLVLHGSWSANVFFNVIMTEVREDLQIGAMTPLPGCAKGIEAKFRIAEVLDININCVQRFKDKIRRQT